MMKTNLLVGFAILAVARSSGISPGGNGQWSQNQVNNLLTRGVQSYAHLIGQGPWSLPILGPISLYNRGEQTNALVTLTNVQIRLNGINSAPVQSSLTSSQLSANSRLSINDYVIQGNLQVIGTVGGQSVSQLGSFRSEIHGASQSLSVEINYNQNSIEIVGIGLEHNLQLPQSQLSGITISGVSQGQLNNIFSQSLQTYLIGLTEEWQQNLPQTVQVLNKSLQGRTLNQVLGWIQGLLG